VKQILITGGAGFIGSHLADALLARGHRVTVVDNESAGSPDNLQAAGRHFDFQYVRGAVENRPLMRELLADVDEVYHLAAPEGVERLARLPARAIQKQWRALDGLVSEMARRHKSGHPMKWFFASSGDVYGCRSSDSLSEDEPLSFGPVSAVSQAAGASKALGEFLALAAQRQHGVPVIIGRLFNVAGPRQSARWGKVLPRLVTCALEGRAPVVHDDGGQTRAFLHVADACGAIADLMETGAVTGNVFNIGGERPISIFQLAERVVAAVDPKLDIEFESYRNTYGEGFAAVRHRVADLTRLKQTIRFEPQYDLDVILTEVIEWLRA
jgi:UDP-glucose 4-epimerase